MKLKPILVLIAFLLWGAGSTYWYVCKIKGFCQQNKAQTETLKSKNTSSSVLSEEQNVSKYALYYKWGETKPIITDTTKLLSAIDKIKSQINLQTTDKKIVITAPYYPDEPNVNGFDNIGLARAQELKKILANYIDSSLVVIKGKLISDTTSPQFIDGFTNLFNIVTIKTKTHQLTEQDKQLINKIENTKIYFPVNSAREIQNDEVYKLLNQLAEFLKKHPDYKVEITGYTDNTGNSQYNEKLGLERAQRIAMLLLNKGVSKNQLIIKSGGEKNPIADNSTPEGRQKNRRVEIKIIH